MSKFSNAFHAPFNSHSLSSRSLGKAWDHFIDEKVSERLSMMQAMKRSASSHSHHSTLCLLAGIAGVAAVTYLVCKKRSHDKNESFAGGKSADHKDHKSVTTKTVLINKPRHELYSFWRDFSRLPEFMENLESVEVDGACSTWRIKAPAGQSVTVKAELVEDIPDEKLVWKSTDDSQIQSDGYISFRDAPAGRGTYVEARIAYVPPAGKAGRLIARIFRREPELQARHDLKRFKMLMETGEIATSASTH